MRRTSWLDRLDRRTVVVHTTDGQSIRGVLVAAHHDVVILAHAFALGSEGTAQTIDGEAHIPRIKVAWTQALPSPQPEVKP